MSIDPIDLVLILVLATWVAHWLLVVGVDTAHAWARRRREQHRIPVAVARGPLGWRRSVGVLMLGFLGGGGIGAIEAGCERVELGQATAAIAVTEGSLCVTSGSATSAIAIVTDSPSLRVLAADLAWEVRSVSIWRDPHGRLASRADGHAFRDRGRGDAPR